MNKSAIAKRLGGAVLVFGLFVGAIALFQVFLIPLFDRGSASALTVLGVHATPDAAGDFMGFYLLTLFALCQCVRGRK